MTETGRLFQSTARYAYRWRMEYHHNRRLRIALTFAGAYGALATFVAIWGWIR